MFIGPNKYFIDKDLSHFALKPRFAKLKDPVDIKIKNWRVPNALWESVEEPVAIQIAANAFAPGGGIFWATAQEEACMHAGGGLAMGRSYGKIPQIICSTAHSLLSKAGMAYRKKLHGYLIHDGVLQYDRETKHPKQKSYTAIFVAGPDFRRAPTKWDQQIHNNFMINALVNVRLTLQHAREARVKTVLLNPIGCGVFKNNPILVATAYRIAISEDQLANPSSPINYTFAIGGNKPIDRALRQVFSHIMKMDLATIQRIYEGAQFTYDDLHQECALALEHHYPSLQQKPVSTKEVKSGVEDQMIYFKPWKLEDQKAQRTKFSADRTDKELEDDLIDTENAKKVRKRNRGIHPDFLQVLYAAKPEMYEALVCSQHLDPEDRLTILNRTIATQQTTSDFHHIIRHLSSCDDPVNTIKTLKVSDDIGQHAPIILDCLQWIAQINPKHLQPSIREHYQRLPQVVLTAKHEGLSINEKDFNIIGHDFLVMMLCDTYPTRLEKVEKFDIKPNSGFLGFFKSIDTQKQKASLFLNNLVKIDRKNQHPTLCKLCQQCELGKKALASSLEKLNTLMASTKNPKDQRGIEVKIKHISQALGATAKEKEQAHKRSSTEAKP